VVQEKELTREDLSKDAPIAMTLDKLMAVQEELVRDLYLFHVGKEAKVYPRGPDFDNHYQIQSRTLDMLEEIRVHLGLKWKEPVVRFAPGEKLPDGVRDEIEIDIGINPIEEVP
jgi:hypothetical protein